MHLAANFDSAKSRIRHIDFYYLFTSADHEIDPFPAMLYRASIFAAILAAGARAVDEDTSCIEETPAESCALQVKLEGEPEDNEYSVGYKPDYKFIICFCFKLF